MNSSQKHVLVVGLCLLAACGDGATSDANPTAGASAFAGAGAGVDGAAGTMVGGTTAGTTATTAGTSAGATAMAGTTAQLTDGGTVPDLMIDSSMSDAPCDYEMEAVTLSADLVIPAGKTVHACPGVTFTSAKDVKIDVLGELIVDGTAAAPVSMLGSAAAPRSWHGLVIESGGSVKLTYTKIGGAIYGLYANAGSQFAINASEFGTSFKAAVLQAEGTVMNTKFVATTPPTIAVTDAVTVDDPNGTVTIIDASPAFTNCKFDGSSAFTDLVRVGGSSAATFDHVSLKGAHCGFHTSGGTNTSIHVTNSIIESMAYGVMAYTTKPIIENSIMRDNGNDVGVCTGATNDNTPVLKNNNYKKGSPTVDAGCFMIGTKDPSPAASPAAGAGASGF